MKRFLGIFLTILLSLFSFAFSFAPSSFAADTCALTSSPATLSAGDGHITLILTDTVGGRSAFAEGDYEVVLSGDAAPREVQGGRFSNPSAQATVDNLGRVIVDFDFTNGHNPNQLKKGTLTINISQLVDGNAGALVCSVNVTVGTSGTGGNNCSISGVGGITPQDTITFKATGFTGDGGQPTDRHHAYIRLNNNDGSTLWEGDPTTSALEAGVSTLKFASGTYYIQVNRQSNFAHLGEDQACYASFTVDPNGGKVNGSGNPALPVPKTPCANNGQGSDGACKTVDTAFGPINTNMANFVTKLMGLILSLAGAIAVFLIIISGYRLMTSQGNPEQIQHAREQLTAALVGLLFTIFSLVILQTIGVSILGIPGFGN